MDESAPLSSLAEQLIASLDMHTGFVETKPWGAEYVLEIPGGFIKIIEVDDGARTSLQYHERKSETIIIFDGSGTVEGTHDDAWERPRPSPGYRIPPNVVHRAIGPVLMLEVTTSENDDVIRIDDDYGRTT